MKVLLVVLCLVSTSLAYNMAWIEWTNFKALHHKVYKSQSEELFRLKMYLINKVAVLSQNIKYRNGHSSFDVEMNKFGDSLSHEIKAVTRGFVPKTGMIDPSATYYNNSQVALPSEVDHRKNKLVNPPREQGSCKSCWAFSATGAIEAQLARKTGVLLRLSQQQLLDCIIDSYGCDGGYMNSAFKYVQKHGGLVTEHIYSYTGEQGNCQVHNRKKLRAKVKGFVNIMPGNEDDLADAIHNIGPISSAIDSRSRMITFYKTGILDLDETQCSSSHVNHAVLVIGYGVEAGKQYWLIKNSWGTDWGEKGYIRIVKNGYNICGVATMPSYPVLE